MESQSDKPQETAPTEEPVAAVPTHETTPVWARTVPVAPPVSDNGTQDALNTAAEADPLPALPMQKDSDPEWAKTETPAEPERATDPKQAVPMQKPAPKWAQTVPAPPGEPVAETELPATTSKRTWPPADGPQTAPESTKERSAAAPLEDVAPLQGAIPEETDVWPPEPPTEHTMPAWPPSSTISKGSSDSTTASTSEPVSSWPDTFDSVPEVTKPPAKIEPPAATTAPAPTERRAATAPPGPSAPTVPPRDCASRPTAPMCRPPRPRRPVQSHQRFRLRRPRLPPWCLLPHRLCRPPRRRHYRSFLR